MASTIRIITNYLSAGRPAKGRVEFLLTAPLRDVAGNIIYEPQTVTATLDSSGGIDQPLIPTDTLDPGSGVVYKVTEHIVGAPARSYFIQVPAASSLGILRLASVAPAAPGPQVFTYALESELTQHVNAAHGGFISPPGWFDIKHPGYGGATAVGNGTTDDTQALNDLIDYLNTSGGIGDLGTGFYKHTADLHTVTNPKASIVGDGARVCTVFPYGDVKSLKLQASPFTVDTGSRLSGFTIDGTHAGANSVGLHLVDYIGAGFRDINVRNFTGTNAIGCWMEVSTADGSRWSERNDFADRCWLDNNTVNLKLSGPAGNTTAVLSFAYNRFWGLLLNVNAGQTGIVMSNGALLYSGTLIFTCNVDGAGTVADIRDIATIQGCELGLHAEQTVGTGGKGFKVGADAHVFGWGISRFENGLAHDIAGGPTFAPKYRVLGPEAKTSGQYVVADGGTVANFGGSGNTGTVVPMSVDDLTQPVAMLAFVMGTDIHSPVLAFFDNPYNGVVFAKLAGGALNTYFELARIDSAGRLVFLQDASANLYRRIAGQVATDGDFAIPVSGKGLRIAEGANAKMGAVQLAAGTATVATTALQPSSRIFVSYLLAAAPAALAVTAKTNGVGFTITSSDSSDTGFVNWLLVDQA